MSSGGLIGRKGCPEEPSNEHLVGQVGRGKANVWEMRLFEWRMLNQEAFRQYVFDEDGLSRFQFGPDEMARLDSAMMHYLHQRKIKSPPKPQKIRTRNWWCLASTLPVPASIATADCEGAYGLAKSMSRSLPAQGVTQARTSAGKSKHPAPQVGGAAGRTRSPTNETSASNAPKPAMASGSHSSVRRIPQSNNKPEKLPREGSETRCGAQVAPHSSEFPSTSTSRAEDEAQIEDIASGQATEAQKQMFRERLLHDQNFYQLTFEIHARYDALAQVSETAKSQENMLKIALLRCDVMKLLDEGRHPHYPVAARIRRLAGRDLVGSGARASADAPPGAPRAFSPSGN